MPALRIFTVTPEAAAFILGCIAERPYREVAPLIDELRAQLRTQDATAPTATSPSASSAIPPEAVQV